MCVYPQLVANPHRFLDRRTQVILNGYAHTYLSTHGCPSGKIPIDKQIEPPEAPSTLALSAGCGIH